MEKTVDNIDATDTLKIKTWVLRVLIHCEGCRKKVTKVIKSIEGVYKIEVDPLQHKVVVTGDFDPNILIKKLCKNGKQAEILHESTTTTPKFDDTKHAKQEEKRPALSSGKSKRSDKNKQENPLTIEAHKNMQAENMVEKKNSSQQTNPAEKMSSGKKVHLVEEKLKALTAIGLGGVDSENNCSEAMKPNKIPEKGEGPNKITENGEGRINSAPLPMTEQFPPKSNVVAPANYKEEMSSKNSSYPIGNGGFAFHAPGHFPPNSNVIAPAENKEVMSSNTLSYDSYPSNNGGFAFHAPPTQQHSYAFSSLPANDYYPPPPPPPDYIRPQSIYHNDDYYDYDDDDKTACTMM